MQINARVNERLLSKANRFFTGDVGNRMIELLQNSRRAGAHNVVVVQEGKRISVQDDGCGIQDWSKLLDLGGSGWGNDIEQGEDPAGVGLFSLAPRKLVVRSTGKLCTITTAGWGGRPVKVTEDPNPIKGTRLEFEDEKWEYDALNRHARFTGMHVFWKQGYQDKYCDQVQFMSKEATHLPEFGCRIGVAHNNRLPNGLWTNNHHNLIVNFHGQIVNGSIDGIHGSGLVFLIDMTGEPTPLKMQLPARENIGANEALTALNEKCVLEGFKYLAKVGHRLPYDTYLRGKKLVPELPESTPHFEVGGYRDENYQYSGRDSRVPEIPGADEMEIHECYLINRNDDEEGFNAHMLALAISRDRHADPFVPITISHDYMGYSWAKAVPTVEIDAVVTPFVHKQYIGPDNMVYACDEIKIIATASDGKTFEKPVRMAWATPVGDDERYRSTTFHSIKDVFLNHDCDESGLMQCAIAPYNEEHNEEKVDEEFWEDFQKFTLMLHGKEEASRSMLVKAVKDIPIKEWDSITIHQEDNSITIVKKDGTTTRVTKEQAEYV